MAKRWTLEDDIFLYQFHEMGADFIASHDLGHHGKGAGTARVKLLRAMGLWDKIGAHARAMTIMRASHILAFSRNSFSLDIAADAMEELGEPLPKWIDAKLKMANYENGEPAA